MKILYSEFVKDESEEKNSLFLRIVLYPNKSGFTSGKGRVGGGGGGGIILGRLK
jgi:hypothetical protein